ncbi:MULTISPECIES: PstS family phosphate ABC transporter substrate-binding protein [Myroides]|uniref:Phosphate ABC transporter substrate-binding protein, PhoT family n=1 Tax=Myroides albus TaxID=2562892 RepID=A0A6I3LEZ4_9FLAO|nr:MULTISPECIES: substrate-binding domain-containing protein [Myroides]MTG97038.1 phosphate ABC transporter substrate-binding protein, PhoT family [Myroides albus]MVX36345.1 phosphate ABC transporter substrate-binding protein, PhoT family [Myroides sp. LoEW2-1]UVD78538.1 substrate-binding domain-containing protein [Myroides albus]
MNRVVLKRARFILTICLLGLGFAQCKSDKKSGLGSNDTKEINFEEIEETPVSGKISILVEESVFPITEDVARVFEHEYTRAKVDLISKPQQEILSMMLKDSLRVAILPRDLNEQELAFFVGKVTPKRTHFATDAIVFVTSKSFKDSVVDYDRVLKNLVKSDYLRDTKDLQSELVKDPILVFDHYSSSVSAAFREATGSRDFPKDYAYFLPSTKDVVKYVNENPNAIGVIGLNWLVQPDGELKDVLKNIKVLGVKNKEDGIYYKASQNNIAEGKYPLTRKIYVIDTQGKSGLGVGFASYIAGYKGQRIVLKSGLVPFKTPPRELNVRNEL